VLLDITRSAQLEEKSLLLSDSILIYTTRLTRMTINPLKTESRAQQSSAVICFWPYPAQSFLVLGPNGTHDYVYVFLFIPRPHIPCFEMGLPL
jgi:hypothetical protein